MRVGAVDLGTNSTRLLVADIEGGRITEVVRRLAITRLGEGVDVSRELLPAPIARVHAVLDRYAAEAATLGVERVLAVATSAVRDASNGPDFLRGLGERYGWATRLLGGAQEAESCSSAGRQASRSRRACRPGVSTAYSPTSPPSLWPIVSTWPGSSPPARR